MGKHSTPGTAGVLFGVILLAVAGCDGLADEIDRPWMPETLPAFVRAMEVGIARELTRDERRALSEATPEELRRTHPRLHEKVSRSYARWTDEWLRRAAPRIDDVAPRRRQRAEQAAARVDDRLRDYFESRGWTYRTPGIVFLPPRLMREPGLREISAHGMYVVYYPHVLFATLESCPTTEHALIHESLHFNKTGPGLGRALSEGICEAAARELSVAWGLATRSELRRTNAYPAELQIVERIVRGMQDRAGIPQGLAVEMLLQAYLTGDSTEVEAILGADTWRRIVEASRARRNVRKTITRALKDL